MSGAPLVAWITRGVRAQVEAIAQRELVLYLGSQAKAGPREAF
ncbi:hypothetical protein R20943_07352 [Paraburkholderia aspalathi]|nr:hypothetical protein R20943_07352 [Paraburkholderia aspalathi]